VIKDEKHFGKRVKQYVKLLKGERLQPEGLRSRPRQGAYWTQMHAVGMIGK
jgi:hypothetical protein